MAAAAILPSQPSHFHPSPFTTNPTPLPSTLKANAGSVPGTQLGWLRPTTMDTPLPEMRRRLAQDDYIFLKGALPRSDILQMRSAYFSSYAHTSLLSATHPPELGIYNAADPPALHTGIGGGDPTGDELTTLLAAHQSDTYMALLAHPRLRGLVRELMGWDEEVLLQRTMLRHNVPGGESTGVHYDKIFLRGGEAFFLTAWVPIGDTRCNGGGLIYLQNGRELGEAIERDFDRRAGEEGFTVEEKRSAFNAHMTDIGILSNHPEEFEREHRGIAEGVGWGGGKDEEFRYRWLVADYEAGDVVFHHPCSVHSSCMNEDPEGRIRLSTDLRFYDKKDFDEGNADERWMKFWGPGDGL